MKLKLGMRITSVSIYLPCFSLSLLLFLFPYLFLSELNISFLCSCAILLARRFTLQFIACRISGKSGDGKTVFSHTQGEPFLFTFGKSEVSITSLFL